MFYRAQAFRPESLSSWSSTRRNTPHAENTVADTLAALINLAKCSREIAIRSHSSCKPLTGVTVGALVLIGVLPMEAKLKFSMKLESETRIWLL